MPNATAERPDENDVIEEPMSALDQAMFNADLERFFDLAFEKQDRGEMTFDQIGAMFPQDVIDRAKSAE